MKTISCPKLLQNIPDAPHSLYIRGTLPDMKKQLNLVVVGSRHHTQYGKQVCTEIIRALKGYPVTIISGLAIGIDTIALTEALRNNLHCIAIPGSGLDPHVLYPYRNRKLAERIVSSGNCLLSEYEPSHTATRLTFPQRNRIMAGCADAVLIIEAQMNSGTSITAGLAVDYNREVLVVPGSIINPHSSYCNELIKEGAIPITEAKDIIKNFNLKKLTPFDR